MKLHKQERVHINGINLVSTRKLNYSHTCESIIANSDSEVNDHNLSQSTDWTKVLNISELPKFSLSEMVSAPYTISLQLDRLQKNYQSECIWLDSKAIKPRILVVENRDSTRNYICSMLQNQFQLIEAKDSNTAIELARKAVAEGTPVGAIEQEARSQCLDLIVCELMMPVINGYDIQNSLRQSAIKRDIPLLFIARHSEPTANSSGAILIEESTIKPLTRQRLLAAITNRLDMAIASR